MNHVYTFTRPSANRQYTAFLKIIKSEPNKNRNYYNEKILGYTAPSQHSNLWASFIRSGLVNINRLHHSVTYSITKKGETLLNSI